MFNKDGKFFHSLQGPRGTGFLGRAGLGTHLVQLLLILLVVIVEARQALRIAAHTAVITGAAQAQAAFLESLVPAVGPIAMLDNQRGIRHLPVVGVLLVPPVIVLDHCGGAPLLVLLLQLLPALVRAIGLLNALGRLVELSLLRIRKS